MTQNPRQNEAGKGGGAQACNIAARLTLMAGRYPDKPAVKFPIGREAGGRIRYRTVTFRELEAEASRLASGLEKAGVTRGMKTILMVRPSVEFYALTFALFKIGAPIVMIDPGMGRRRMVECLASIEAEAFVGIPLSHLLRVLYPSAFKNIRIAVTVGRRWCWGGSTFAKIRASAPEGVDYPAAETAPGEMAAILFTTGSTGPPKGVVYHHRTFAAQVDYLESAYGYGPEEIDLPTFPLFGLFDAVLGMTAVIPEMDFTKPGSVDAAKLVRAIEQEGVTHTFGSPALLRRVTEYGAAHGVKLPTVRRVISAGAPVPAEVLEQYRSMLNGDAEIFTPYGATESLPVSSIESREILGETARAAADGRGVCVGRPMRGLDVRIIKIDDGPIAEWDERLCLGPNITGEIAVKGPVVTSEYYRLPEATALAKIAEGEGVWHRMGDAGYLDLKGRLWFCGRKAHRVTTGEGDLFTIPCEAIFNRHELVRRTALVGLGERGAQIPVLCIELEPDAAKRYGLHLARILRENPDRKIEAAHYETAILNGLREAGRKFDHTRGIERLLIHPGFPVDIRHNAKIFREKLAVWAGDQIARDPNAGLAEK